MLGTYSVTQGNDYTVSLTDQADGTVIADAIKLVRTSTPPATGTRIVYVHTNHLGTPQVLTDENQQIVWEADYEPFGEATIITEVVTNNLRFPGQYYDEETGLHYNYFRDYDPRIGRYIESDPIGLAGGINIYGYANLNPIVKIDPTGEISLRGLFGKEGGKATKEVIERNPGTKKGLECFEHFCRISLFAGFDTAYLWCESNSVGASPQFLFDCATACSNRIHLLFQKQCSSGCGRQEPIDA